jgi:hypothetical protein
MRRPAHGRDRAGLNNGLPPRHGRLGEFSLL